MKTTSVEQEEMNAFQDENIEQDLEICERIIIEDILFKIPKKSWMIEE